ncbi:MAG: sigma-70 family RNA polymerase sigma factor [Phycisphaerae bacterium]
MAEASPPIDWASFYLAHRRALTAYAVALAGNAADAADLIQDVLLRVIAEQRAPDDAIAYVMRCLRNRAIDLRRRHGLAAAELDVAVPIDDGRGDARRAESPETARRDIMALDAHTREIAALAKRALEALPATQREVLVLRIYGERTFAEIASILERPLGTVASLYSRGIDEIRGVLAMENEGVCD